MKKTILIAPFDGTLAAALATEARAEGWSVALALARGLSAAPAECPQDLVSISYEPRSYVSATSLAISARNAIGELDAVIDRIGELEGVERTTSAIVLSTRIER